MAVIWGTNYSIVKFAFHELDPAGIQRGADDDRLGRSSWRSSACLRFGRLASTERRRRTGLVEHLPHANATDARATLPSSLALGFVGHFLYQYFFIGGLALTTVANSSLMLASTPVVIAAHQRDLRPGARQCPRTGSAPRSRSLGIYIVVGRGVEFGGRGFTGDLMMVAAVDLLGGVHARLAPARSRAIRQSA